MRAISDPNELKILTSLKQKRGYNPQNKDKIVKLQLSGYKGLYAELRGENDFSQVCERSSQWCELRYSQVQTAH